MFVALGIGHDRTMRSIMLSVVCQGLSYFSILSHKPYGLRNTDTECIKCVLIFYTNLCVTFLISSITKTDDIITIYRYAYKVPRKTNLIIFHPLEDRFYRADKWRGR